jgi:hypothetical protein
MTNHEKILTIMSQIKAWCQAGDSSVVECLTGFLSQHTRKQNKIKTKGLLVERVNIINKNNSKLKRLKNPIEK